MTRTRESRNALYPWLTAAIVIATWWYGWRVPLMNAETGEEPAGETRFIVAYVVGSFLFGSLLPRHARWSGPVLLSVAVIWIVVHIFTHDGSAGASFWPIASLMILASMPILSLAGLLGRWVRGRVDPAE